MRKKKKLRGSRNPKVQAGLLKWQQGQILRKVKKVMDGTLPKKKLSKLELADKRVVPAIKIHLNAGQSYKKIAHIFNFTGTRSRRGGKWSAVQIWRVVKRNNLKRKGNILSPEELSIAGKGGR